jgi:hypothetical protein
MQRGLLTSLNMVIMTDRGLRAGVIGGQFNERCDVPAPLQQSDDPVESLQMLTRQTPPRRSHPHAYPHPHH